VEVIARPARRFVFEYRSGNDQAPRILAPAVGGKHCVDAAGESEVLLENSVEAGVRDGRIRQKSMRRLIVESPTGRSEAKTCQHRHNPEHRA
jgi:hypothetical protein